VKEILIRREIENPENNQKENRNTNLTVREILLLNKRSGLPIFSRVYKKTSGKDPALSRINGCNCTIRGDDWK
jgi:hypothetical protein